MDLLVQVGLIELAVGALLGWAVVLRKEKPDLLQRLGLRRTRAVLQAHIDYLMMGLILIAVGAVLRDPPGLLAAVLIFGTIVNPLLFFPGAVDPAHEKRILFRVIAGLSFTAVSAGLVWAAILGPA